MTRRGAVMASLAVVALAGCGGPAVDRARDVAAFDRLDVAGGLHVQVVPGPRTAVSVRGRADVLDRISTESVGGVLRVAVHDRGIVIGHDPMDDVRVRVTAPRLQDVRVDGQGDIDLGDVRTQSLRFEVNGAGAVRSRGTVDRLTAVVHGAADADFSRLAARDARIEIAGAADMTLDVSEHLDVRIDGAGSVAYTGDPTVTKAINGPGEVRQIAP